MNQHQPPISNEVLLEKMQGFFDKMIVEMGFLRRDLTSYEERLKRLEDHEALSAEWHHTHDQGPSHSDTQRKMLDFESALGEVRKETVRMASETREDLQNRLSVVALEVTGIRTRESERKEKEAYKKGVSDGMARSLSWLDKGYVTVVAGIPTALLIFALFK